MTALRPRVSVVVACYNYGHFLTTCVESALRQEGVDVDVTVIDDASTDGSASIGSELVERHGIRFVRHQVNAGYIASYNEALSMAEGEYVVKLDADDALPRGALQRAAALMTAHPQVGFTYGRPYHFTDGAPRPTPHPVRRWQLWPGHEWLERRCRSGVNCISNPEVVMRRSVLDAVGHLRPELQHTCDLELWLRLAAAADVGRVRGPYQGCYRVHSNSMQRTVNAGALTDLRGRRDAFASFFQDVPTRLPDAARLRSMAFRSLCEQALDAACRAFDRGRVDEMSVSDLIEFAAACDHRYRELPAWRALEHRRRVGSAAAQYMPPFFLRAVQRRLSEEIGKLRWQATGV